MSSDYEKNKHNQMIVISHVIQQTTASFVNRCRIHNPAIISVCLCIILHLASYQKCLVSHFIYLFQKFPILSLTPGRSLESTNQYVTFTRNQPSYANLTPRSVNLPPSENHYELVGWWVWSSCHKYKPL